MSAPDTNTDKQVRRHRGPLYGMAVAAAFAGGLFILFLGWTALQGDEPVEETATPAPANAVQPATETQTD